MSISMTTVKNRLKVSGLPLVYNMKNVRINGTMVGCVGFITNTDNGKVVYVNTEGSSYGPLQGKVMFREAEHVKDFRGGHNQWASVKYDAYVSAIVDELKIAPRG